MKLYSSGVESQIANAEIIYPRDDKTTPNHCLFVKQKLGAVRVLECLEGGGYSVFTALASQALELITLPVDLALISSDLFVLVIISILLSLHLIADQRAPAES
jgi:hypothetical protein